MKNQELARIFHEIADYLAMDSIPFKPQAYKKAALALEALGEDVEKVYKEGGIKALENISGIGQSLAEKIEEYLKTGRIKYYESFKKRLPFDLQDMIRVEGLGPKRAKILYHQLGIANLKQLEKAVKLHKIATLPGFGVKTEKNILEGIQFVKRSKGRFLLGEILPKAKEVFSQIKVLKEVKEISFAGSLRRMRETIGDVDFLVISEKPKVVMDFFVLLPGIVKVWGKGPTKASVRVREGFDMDLRVVAPRSYGAALQYFTGSKDHNIATRRIAMEKGLKLSEYGLFKGSKMIASRKEEDVYKILGLPWIPPEIRENQGEIEAGLAGKLPKLIELKDIKGDLHCHSNWDGGADSIADLADSAMRLGYEYLGIADHTKYLRIEHGLTDAQLIKRSKEIDKLNLKLAKHSFRVLKGCETNIMADGSVDIKDETLVQMDYVIAGIHSQLRMEKEAMTERIIIAMRNPNIDIISHPTGRLIQKRDECLMDFDKILRAAKEYNVCLEINAYPERLDLNDQNIRRTKNAGVRMAINSDAHRKDQFRFMEYGVAQARRGWAEKNDIINAQPLNKLLSFFH